MMGALYIVGQCASTQMACDLCCCGYALLSTFLHEWTAWLVETQYSMCERETWLSWCCVQHGWCAHSLGALPQRITLRRSQRDCDWISARMNDVDEGIGNGFARPPAADAAAGNEVEVSVEESRFDLHEALVEHYHQQCVSESSFWMRTAVQAHRARRAQQEQE
uniref:Uncharacterized protein n=1 Tax=Chrysotila carterae TaxID=13221 RepID=A0A7S4EVH7_CHRCT